jgi:trimeric autotransporter adhesin
LNNLRTSERDARRPARSILVALMAVLMSLFAVGCGSSSGDFVATGNNGSAPQPPLAQTGSVTFQLVKAQTATVPQATEFVLVEFFNRANVSLFLPAPVAFGTGTFTIEGVPITATQARLTALDANNNPISISIATFQVVPGGDVVATVGQTVLLSFDIDTTPNPASVAVNATRQLSLDVIFTDGTVSLPPAPASSVTGATFSFTSADPQVATVSSGGLITGVSVGNTTVNVTLTLNGVTKTDSVSVNVTNSVTPPPDPGAPRLEVSPTSVTLTNTSVSQTIEATFFPANATTGQVVTAQTTAANPPTGITYSAGTITSTTIQNTTANLVISFTPTGGSAVNATVAVTVSRLAGGGANPGTPARLVLSQPNLFVDATTPVNGVVNATFFPANSTVGTTLGFNTLTGVPKNAAPVGTENTWTFNTAANTIVPSGGGGGAATNSTVVFTMTHTPPGGTAVTADLNVTAVAAGDPRLTAVTNSKLIGATNLSLPSGTVYPFVVVNTLGNGSSAVAATGTAAVGAVSIDPASSNTIGSYGTAAGPPVHNNLSAAAVPASGNVILRRVTSLTPLSFTPVATVSVNVTNTTLLAGGAPNVVLTPSANSVKSGETLPFKVEWLFQDNTRLDVTPFYNITESDPPLDFNLTPAAMGGLSPGFVTADPGLGAVTPGTIAINAIINAVITPPAGTPVPSATANVSVTP